MNLRRMTATHWGNFLVDRTPGGALSVTPAPGDDQPSAIGRSLAATQDPRCRIARPAIRRGYYEHRRASDTTQRGREPFVEVEWDEALDIAAQALSEARDAGGNKAIYAGSYGWGSAGRFHHAQGQIHRFMRLFGGYTDSVDSYSFAAAEVLIPHVLGMNAYYAAAQAPTTREIAQHCRRIVFFGGAAVRNAQVNSGGIGRHDAAEHFAAIRDGGVEIVNISPIRDDVLDSLDTRWLACRPNSDVAIMLGMLHTLIVEDRYDREFVSTYCTGFDRLADYVTGRNDGRPKDAAWASTLSELPAEEIRALARSMAEERCLIGVTYSLQRAEHGEQTHWAAWSLAAALGHIGLPGGGVLMGTGVERMNTMQRRYLPFKIGTIPRPPNPVQDVIPVARIADLLEHPGETFSYNGRTLTYPHIDLVYWAGGNPFHHHQDINRLRRAWTRPKTVIVNEPNWTTTARMADIVFPVTSPLERSDFAGSSMDHWLTPMHAVLPPYGEARDDYDVFTGLAKRLGFEAEFTEGRNADEWLEHLWDVTRRNAGEVGISLPDFASFRESPPLDLRPMLEERPLVLERFRQDPAGHPLDTPSGRIELFSQTIADAGCPDCVGHPAWYDKREWLGSPQAERFPLHLLSNQPSTRLHSQLDHGVTSQEAKIRGREPLRMNPRDAAARNIRDGDVVRVFNDRGALLAGARVSDALRPGVVQLATGAWYDVLDPADPLSLEIHGNPNALTNDIGSSSFAQGPSANSCLVEVERYDGALPELKVFAPPLLDARPLGQQEERRTAP
jgi:biotin/methionine sulfoxide reductase